MDDYVMVYCFQNLCAMIPPPKIQQKEKAKFLWIGAAMLYKIVERYIEFPTFFG